MKVEDVMSEIVYSCTPEDTLEEAAQIMRDYRCAALPVVEEFGEQRMVGIITRRDIVCRAVAQDERPSSARVKRCMTTSVHSISPGTPVQDCRVMMEEKHLRRFPVVDDDGYLCGIIALSDILRSEAR